MKTGHMMRLIIIFGVAVVGFCVWFVLFTSDTKPEAPRNSSVVAVDDNSRIQDLEKRLERRLRRLEASQIQLSRASIETNDSPDAEESVSSNTGGAVETAATTEEAELILQQKMATETADSEWQSTMFEKLEGFIESNELVGANITDVSCSSSMCQVNMDYNSRNDHKAFMQVVMEEMGRYDGFDRNYTEDGVLKSHLFLMKTAPVKYIDKNGNEYDPDV